MRWGSLLGFLASGYAFENDAPFTFYSIDQEPLSMAFLRSYMTYITDADQPLTDDPVVSGGAFCYVLDVERFDRTGIELIEYSIDRYGSVIIHHIESISRSRALSDDLKALYIGSERRLESDDGAHLRVTGVGYIELFTHCQ